MPKTFLPFRSDMRAAVERGEKTMTTRTERYGYPRDVLAIPGGRRVRLTSVERMPLCLVAERYHVQEGFPTPEAFKAAWCQIHPGRGWNPELRVFVHTFELVEARDA